MTSRQHLVRTILGGSLVLPLVYACGDVSPPSPSAVRSQSALSTELAACPTRAAIWLDQQSNPQCPNVGGWLGSKLFSSKSPALAPFCRYVWAEEGAPNFEALTSVLGDVEPDCPVVGALGTAQEAFEETWKAQSGWVAALPEADHRVRVAILDTAAHPFTSTGLDTDPHGRAVGMVAHQLGCPTNGQDGACVIEVVNQLALPVVSGETEDWTHGGHFGSRGHLAVAIENAVDNWLTDRLNDPQTPARLIINLSLGWEPTYGSTMLSAMTPANDAVYRALERAVCAGALVIAAAGNGGDFSDAAMFPAAWEAAPAPSPSRCGEFDLPAIDAPVHAPPGSYAPLVHAIGGVGPRDLPLVAMRSGGQPRLAAHALSVYTSDDRADGHTYSGTSMAAATASGIAAVTWALDPIMTGAQVMQALHDGGESINSPEVSTNVCLGYTGCSSIPVKRIHLCGAVNAVAPNHMPGCQATVAFNGDWPGFDPPSTTWSLPKALETCSPGTCAPTSPGRVVRPWVDPQPTPRCGVCMLDGVNLFASLVLPDMTTGIVLTTYDAAGTMHRERLLPPADPGWGLPTFPSDFVVETRLTGAAVRAALTVTVDGFEPTHTTIDIVAR